MNDYNWRNIFHTLVIYNHALTVVMRRWQLTEHVSFLSDISTCADLCHETMTTDGAWFILEGYITILWPLLLDDDNWRSMFHTLGMCSQKNTLPCSDRCHEMMSTDRTCLILEVYITILWPLSWDDDNWRSMFHTLGMYNHALSISMRRWQMMEHVSYMNDIFQCSDLCHKSMTTDGASFMPKGYVTMLYPLAWCDDNWRSMFHIWMIYYNALTCVMRRWQLTEHESYLKDILSCSDRFHEMITVDRAYFIH